MYNFIKIFINVIDNYEWVWNLMDTILDTSSRNTKKHFIFDSIIRNDRFFIWLSQFHVGSFVFVFSTCIRSFLSRFRQSPCHCSHGIQPVIRFIYITVGVTCTRIRSPLLAWAARSFITRLRVLADGYQID